MPKKNPNTTVYPIQFENDLYARMKECAKIDGRSLRRFIVMACQEKVERIEMESITRPWIPSGLRR